MPAAPPRAAFLRLPVAACRDSSGPAAPEVRLSVRAVEGARDDKTLVLLGTEPGCRRPSCTRVTVVRAP